jgi:hypothetical protein
MGPFLATQFGMVHEIYATEQRTGVAGPLRVIRAFAVRAPKLPTNGRAIETARNK